MYNNNEWQTLTQATTTNHLISCYPFINILFEFLVSCRSIFIKDLLILNIYPDCGFKYVAMKPDLPTTNTFHVITWKA